MNSHMEKIFSLTTGNNIKLAPLAFEYVKNFAVGIGMPEEKNKDIALLTREVLERRMLNGYKGVGEIAMDILVGLDRSRIEIADRGIPYWVIFKENAETARSVPMNFL